LINFLRIVESSWISTTFIFIKPRFKNLFRVFFSLAVAAIGMNSCLNLYAFLQPSPLGSLTSQIHNRSLIIVRKAYFRVCSTLYLMRLSNLRLPATRPLISVILRIGYGPKLDSHRSYIIIIIIIMRVIYIAPKNV